MQEVTTIPTVSARMDPTRRKRERERKIEKKKNTRRNTFFFLLMHLLCDNHYTVHLNFDMLLTFETHVRTFTQCHSFLTDLILQ